jgi:hypothetical protein
MGETCSPGDGQPKYGDYNGNACSAAGRLFTAWASATPPPGIPAPTPPTIDIFFASRLVVSGEPEPEPQGPDLTIDSGVGCDGTLEFRILNTGNEEASGFLTEVFIDRIADRVICDNLTTGQSVITLGDPTEENCVAAGLMVNPGDEIRITTESGPTVCSPTTDASCRITTPGLGAGDFRDVSVPVPDACFGQNVPIEQRGCEVSIFVDSRAEVTETDETNNTIERGRVFCGTPF